MSERIDPVDAAAAQEFPDRVGFKPNNPYLENFRPYIPAELRLRELTPLPLIMGTLLGMVFGASSLYLVLKVGLTVSASIPVAVISITLFRVLSKVGLRDATILENNIVQTAGSAGESIAFGVGVTMPAIMILGLDLEVTRVMLVAILGGLLGILMMIPLRRALIVAQHGYLKYPEGTACAEVLKAGASDESRAAAHRAGDVVDETEQMGAKTIFAGLGVGFLYQVLMTGLKGGLADLRGGSAASAGAPRTDQDMSMKVVIGGIIVLLALIMLFPQLNLRFNLIGAVLIVAFGFLFVTVSSRLTGEIGSSSNPISGMTVATLLLTCLIFLVIGWTGPSYYITALSIGGIVCIASSNGGTTPLDLKTGFPVGSTPRFQQIAILVGAFASALILGPILLVLNDSATVYVPRLSFEPATKSVIIDPAKASSLPAFTDQVKPSTPGNYRVLKNEAAAPVVAELDPGEYLVDASGKVVYKVEENFPATLKIDPSQAGAPEKLKGPQANADSGLYRPYHKIDTTGGPAGRYLVNDQGAPVYLADPGINGIHKTRPDGSQVTKYDAPKATLMSYIIKGILNRQLPWGLVLLGVMIAIVLEMSGIPSLAFAVGVYLPLSSSSPIFIGGMIRLLVDKYLCKKLQHKKLTEEEFVAETDKSPGVLMASGYIAGGALAAIVIAILQGVPKWGLPTLNRNIEDWNKLHNPLFNGPNADLLSVIPFLVLAVLLYLVGREVILRSGKVRGPG